MIPVDNDTINFKLNEHIDTTYQLDISKNRIKSYKIDQKEAVKQASFLILNTERYDCVLYSWNFGIETKDLIGKSPSYVYPELCERIKEALIQDSRITSVNEFSYEILKNKMTIYFTIYTIYGDFDSHKEVYF